MAIIIPPAPLPLRDKKVRLRDPSQENTSKWTGTSKIIGLPGAAEWLVSGTFASISDEAKARPWRAFFVALRGKRNAFRIRVGLDQQTAVGNPTVRAGGSAGLTVPLQGLPASQTVLEAGHLMTVTLPSGHERLVCLTASLVSDAQGRATATFAPELGEVPQAGAAVEIQWPHALVRMSDDTNGWEFSERIKHGFAIDTKEAK
ncbi:hypothetical protein CA234_03110 [Sphingomonas sp. ABOLE]|uniref:hypothetical protein n=1 Tax=Sphingomonas sp. ABOLE TaxID=1985878 RepID=UPI000F7EB8BC|nr:hypothetical protein [Sphingomonas sp. ABOLE]RSV44419.1 hypothetical protein CA234_03110 [Sphingomonas sp. ABOLE]